MLYIIQFSLFLFLAIVYLRSHTAATKKHKNVSFEEITIKIVVPLEVSYSFFLQMFNLIMLIL